LAKVRLDNGRFRKALLYVAQKGSIDPEFGLIKIYKALIIADILGMSTLGQTVTHWKYLHFEKGPVPCDGHHILDSLKEQDVVREMAVPIGPHILKRLVVLKPVAASEFTPEELSLMDMAVGIVTARTASQVSEMSHQLPAWRWSQGSKLIKEELLKYPFLISEVRLTGSRLDEALASAREQGLA
jgi:hypothetical protein